MYFIVEQPASIPHRAHPEGCAVLRSVLVTVPRVSRSCEHVPDEFDLHLLLVLDSLFRQWGPPPPHPRWGGAPKEVVPKRARIQGPYTIVPLNSRLENNQKGGRRAAPSFGLALPPTESPPG